MAALSVLMSIYIKEKPEYVDACFKSLLRQTIQADEWVVVEDGPLTGEMYKLLEEYQQQYPELIKRVPLHKNQGLGLALRAGVPLCKNALIARMDTDDIAREDRFEKQLKAFQIDPCLDICGSNISEFEDSPDRIIAKRIVPETDREIKQYQKMRDAFNHMTVMYKKESVLAAGNYQSCPLMEDTLLWVRMIQNGSTCRNLRESLVYVRIGKEMYERRGGWSYFLKYRDGRKKIRATGYINTLEYHYSILVQLCVSLLPNRIRGWLYKRILHNETAKT